MRFTSRAKHAVFFDARDQAGAMGHGYVGGEHILLALLGEREGLAARVLDSCGITLEQVLGQVSRIGGAGGESPARLDHNGEATQVVEVAQTESGALGHERVGTAHVLLALLSQGGGAAVKVVRGLGGDPQPLRARVLAEIEAGHGDYDAFSKAAREVVALAEGEARGLDHEYVGAEHLLLALLRDQPSVAFRVLGSLGITPGGTRKAVLGKIAGAGEAPAGPIPLTPEARRALELAGAEAHSSGSWVNPEHVLLGLAREGEVLGARLLFDLAGGPDEVRNAVLRELSEQTGYQGYGFFERFTGRAAEVVVLAQEEARNLEHDQIGSEHILLSLLREQETAAGTGVDALNTALDRAREQVDRSTGPRGEPVGGLLPFAASARKVFELARLDMLWLEHDYIAAEHIALGLARETDGVGARVLQELNVDTEHFRAQALTALGASWASELSPAQEELSRQEQRLREAQRQYRKATTEEERRKLEVRVDISQSIVDSARGAVLPASCREALNVLVDFATEEWLKGQPPPEDPDHRRWYQQHGSSNIENQLLSVLFHPALGPEANPITGHPGGPDAPDPRKGPTPFTLRG